MSVNFRTGQRDDREEMDVNGKLFRKSSGKISDNPRCGLGSHTLSLQCHSNKARLVCKHFQQYLMI